MSYADYPITYRHQECQRILQAVRAGDSAYVIGLSGAGKSNLIGFLAERYAPDGVRLVHVDLNRLIDNSPNAIFSIIRWSQRLTEFWNEQPTAAELKASGITNAPILRVKPKGLR